MKDSREHSLGIIVRAQLPVNGHPLFLSTENAESLLKPTLNITFWSYLRENSKTFRSSQGNCISFHELMRKFAGLDVDVYAIRTKTIVRNIIVTCER